ncbi:MAG: tRNA (cytidine(34)-2'-O)-methyltransferase [Campylobacterales bacterium]
MIHIVLVHPKIPQNVGNIGRTCVAIQAKLHIIKPIPFFIDDKHLRRAGMDYWHDLDVSLWEGLDSFWEAYPVTENHFFITTKGEMSYFDARLPESCWFYFGSEDAGLAADILALAPERNLRLPMDPKARSLNLSNAVAIVAYEARRQIGWGSLR